jgi:hypothetical protein
MITKVSGHRFHNLTNCKIIISFLDSIVVTKLLQIMQG